MGTITVEGIGEVEIKGNTPTKEEFEIIEKAKGFITEPPAIPEPIHNIEYQKTEDFASGLKKGFTDRETTKAALSLGGFTTGLAAGAPFGPVGSAIAGPRRSCFRWNSRWTNP